MSSTFSTSASLNTPPFDTPVVRIAIASTNASGFVDARNIAPADTAIDSGSQSRTKDGPSPAGIGSDFEIPVAIISHAPLKQVGRSIVGPERLRQSGKIDASRPPANGSGRRPTNSGGRRLRCSRGAFMYYLTSHELRDRSRAGA